MRRQDFVGLVVSCCLLASCSSGGDSSEVASSLAGDSTVAVPADSSTEVNVVVRPEDIDGPLKLTPMAIGPYMFGTPVASVIVGMTTMFGEPSEDTGWSTDTGPCEGVGSRTRYVTWGRVTLTFADGPTMYVPKTGERLSSYFVSDDPDQATPAERFVLNDDQPALGRSENEMLSWNRKVTFPNSEIEGPLWAVGDGMDQLSGMFAPPDDGNGAARTRSVRAGVFCID